MKIKSLIFLIFIYLISFVKVYAIDPEIFVQSTGNRASKVLSDNTSKKEKVDELKKIAKDTVDIQGIGFYTLGKKVRKTLNEQQKQNYSEINVLGKEILNKNYTIVNSILKGTNERPEIKIDWRIYTKDPEKPLIRDLIIEGLSLARTQKEEFSSVLQTNNNDINELFKTLKKFTEQ